eukprot:gene21672-28689_t
MVATAAVHALLGLMSAVQETGQRKDRRPRGCEGGDGNMVATTFAHAPRLRSAVQDDGQVAMEDEKEKGL